MIKPLDIEKLNRVAPYRVEETDDVGFYQLPRNLSRQFSY